MKAAVVTKGHKVEIKDRTLRPLKEGEVKLKMECCGVCHTDLHAKNGDFKDCTGITLGHEGVGIVTELHPSVKSLNIGDRVTVAWMYSACGHCEYCISGRETMCYSIQNSGFTIDGAMAEECIAVANYAVKVPEGLDSAAASSITCAGVTVYKAIKISGIRPGQWLIMYGLGGLGNLGLQYAKNVFNAKVICVDLNDEQLALAKEMGADLTINPSKENVVNTIKDHTGGIGAHVAIVTAPAAAAYRSSIESVRHGASVVGVGLTAADLMIGTPYMILGGIQLIGSPVGTREDLAEAMKFAAEGKVIPKVDYRNIEEVNEIFDEMLNHKFTGRMVIKFNS